MAWPPKKLAVLAGGGVLPRDVVATCASEGIPYLVVNLGGAADDWIKAHNPLEVSLGQVGKLFDVMRAENCDAVTMAGHLTRPQLSKLRFDWQGAKMLPRVAMLFRKGDDALLRGIAGLFEEHGFNVIGPERVVRDALASEGVLTDALPKDDALTDIALAHAILASLGPHDVGQAAVVANGVCLAVEAAEGTARMLKRVADLRVSQGPSGVLVKLPKPGQDRRVDLPTIGPDTVTAAQNARLAGIAVEAGSGFILDRDETVRLCDEAGLFLVGLQPSLT